MPVLPLPWGQPEINRQGAQATGRRRAPRGGTKRTGTPKGRKGHKKGPSQPGRAGVCQAQPLGRVAQIELFLFESTFFKLEGSSLSSEFLAFLGELDLGPRRAHVATWRQRAPTEVGRGPCGGSQTPPVPTATRQRLRDSCPLSPDGPATALFYATGLVPGRTRVRGPWTRGSEGTERHEGPRVACEGRTGGAGPCGARSPEGGDRELPCDKGGDVGGGVGLRGDGGRIKPQDGRAGGGAACGERQPANPLPWRPGCSSPIPLGREGPPAPPQPEQPW